MSLSKRKLEETSFCITPASCFLSFGKCWIFFLLSALPVFKTRFKCFVLFCTASREAAYLHAITAAGVSHAVTASCGEGNLQSCDCDRSLSGTATQKGWTWSGCSSNVKFGTWFSEQFTDASKKGNSPRAVMNRHNSRAGRKVCGYV